MKAKGTDKEWGVKSIKKRREDEHGNIEFLVEWDGDWADTWEPQVNLKNAQHKIDTFLPALHPVVAMAIRTQTPSSRKGRLNLLSEY